MDRMTGAGRLIARSAGCAVAAGLLLAGCTAHRADTTTGRTDASGATDRSEAKGKTGRLPLFGFRVVGRVSPLDPREVQVAASHRSRNHRIDRIVLLSPRGRAFPALALRKDRRPARGSRVWGPASAGIGIGTYGVGFGIGAPLNFDAFLDSVLLSERSSWRHRTLATLKRPRGFGRRPGWRVRVTLTERSGRQFDLVRPLVRTDVRPVPD